VTILNNESLFPDLDEIAFIGHSAGGQYILRYAWMTHLKPEVDLVRSNGKMLDLRFVVMNPSSYLYPTEDRWEMTCGECDCDSAECRCTQNCNYEGGLHIPHMEGTKYPCLDAHYNDWPYGLAGWMPQYVSDVDKKEALRAFQKRDVRFAVGERDMCNENLGLGYEKNATVPGGVCEDECWTKYNKTGLGICYRNHMDTRCPAMMQGQFRKIRGLRYNDYMMRYYMKTDHPLYVIPNVGHDANGMFNSEKGIQMIFEHAKGCLEGDDKLDEKDDSNHVSGRPMARIVMQHMSSAVTWSPQSGWTTALLAASAFSVGLTFNLLKGSKNTKEDQVARSKSYGAVDSY